MTGRHAEFGAPIGIADQIAGALVVTIAIPLPLEARAVRSAKRAVSDAHLIAVDGLADVDPFGVAEPRS